MKLMIEMFVPLKKNQQAHIPINLYLKLLS